MFGGRVSISAAHLMKLPTTVEGDMLLPVGSGSHGIAFSH